LKTSTLAASFDHIPSSEFQEPVLSAPSAPEITLYTSAVCGYCVAAKNFLKSKGLSWNEVRIDTDPVQREKMLALARRTSVPQIFIGDTHVGGCDELVALDQRGGLMPLLNGAQG
jgi:glutaredoxin 3